jgi:hypothetical protein
MADAFRASWFRATWLQLRHEYLPSELAQHFGVARSHVSRSLREPEIAYMRLNLRFLHEDDPERQQSTSNDLPVAGIFPAVSGVHRAGHCASVAGDRIAPVAVREETGKAGCRGARR